MSRKQIGEIKVAHINTIILPGSDNLGRYVLIRPLTPWWMFIGAEGTFFDSAGRKITGKIVNMREEINEGKFPEVAESDRIVDTRPPTVELKRKRMAQGGLRSLSNSAPLTRPVR